MRAAVLLALLCACQTPRSQGWQDTPTEARDVHVIVLVFNLGGAVRIERTGVDQSGNVGEGGTTETKSKQETKVDAQADVQAIP
jgi:hypothetical protein